MTEQEQKVRVFESSGLYFDTGEIPQCEYCGKTIDEVPIYETIYNGVYACQSELDCELEVGRNGYRGEIKEVKQ